MDGLFPEGAEWNEEFEGTASGWRMDLALLKHYLDNYFGSSRTSFRVMRPAEFSFEQVVPLYRTGAGLRKWLTKSGDYGEVGEGFALDLQEAGNAERSAHVPPPEASHVISGRPRPNL